MYIKRCEYCGEEFKSQQPNAKYCGPYHAGKARTDRKKAKNKKKEQ